MSFELDHCRRVVVWEMPTICWVGQGLNGQAPDGVHNEERQCIVQSAGRAQHVHHDIITTVSVHILT